MQRGMAGLPGCGPKLQGLEMGYRVLTGVVAARVEVVVLPSR